MAQLEYSSYEGFGKDALEHSHYSQAVRVPPNRVECSGQGGLHNKTRSIPQDLDEQVELAFANVDLALRTAGVKDGWKQVFSVRSYHVGAIGEKTREVMLRNFRKWMPDHRPIWTMLGVPTLALEDMKVEIEVVAFDEEGK